MKRQLVVVVAATMAAATVAGVAFLVRQWRRQSNQQLSAQRILREFASWCATPTSKLWQVANEMASGMEAELTPGDRGGNLGVPVSYLADRLSKFDCIMPMGNRTCNKKGSESKD
ncbi:hypothetical protein SASPL_143931 [Salvia splendens]|uniref:Phosphotransferase n=1 Tax=Salvia splendens TaxID=180675 RepID=A0A8X8WN26_SALSN|nr:hypothetical protein SASPL_143931 [Salvia splendens]